MPAKRLPPPSTPELPISPVSRLTFWIVVSAIGALTLVWMFRPVTSTGNDNANKVRGRDITQAGSVQ